MTLTAGIDVGTGVVKAAIFRVEDGKEEWLSKCSLRIRSRDPMELAREAFDQALEDAGVKEEDIDYVATTGEGEAIPFHTGHFYSMTSHARGAQFLNPETGAILDSGALHGRAMIIDEKGKVTNYKMTSQCASGSGQFLENIARYLGIAQDEIGSLSVQGDDPEEVSSICAVLAETDVINMVSRGITSPNILKGIHLVDGKPPGAPAEIDWGQERPHHDDRWHGASMKDFVKRMREQSCKDEAAVDGAEVVNDPEFNLRRSHRRSALGSIPLRKTRQQWTDAQGILKEPNRRILKWRL